MPCWVVPAVAAEFWGTSVEQVLADVAAGRLNVQTEAGLLFVSVATCGEPHHEPLPKPACRRSLAWAMPGVQGVISAAEQDALLSIDDQGATLAGTDTAGATDRETDADVPESVHDEGEPAPLEDGPEEGATPAEPTTEAPPEWQSIRSRVGRMRRAPHVVRDAAQAA